MDPELAMALRVSMEEERARQERLAARRAEQETSEDSKDADMTDAQAVVNAMDMGLSEEEALLQQALAMSMNENEPRPQEDSKPSAADMDEDDEAAAMQLALQMSMQAEPPTGSEEQQFQDPQFVNQLLGTLPGVDPNDPAIQRALKNLQGDKKEEEDDKKKDGESSD
mmetsp:Transcript_87811/g.171769  ORF Transcript_87811/g.171769 Transcript_87811/m.171769 type:complete len:168 (+) Transcript_87811:113-616(+)